MKPREDDLYSRVGIYGIRNKIDGKIYVGQTNMNFGDRRDSHISLLNNNKHKNKYLQNAWNKYKEANFEFVVLHDLKEDEDINQLEIDYIAKYKELGIAYNIADGGNNYAHGPLSEETKRKIGEKNRINGLGRKASKETKKKMSESHKRYINSLTEEEKKNRVAAMHQSKIGVKWTDEQRKKYSDEQHINPHGAKYNVDIIREIRRLYEKENKTLTEISEQMNIPRGTVYGIATYRRWKHVS